MRFLLLLVFGACSALSLHAQAPAPYYRWELGLSAGISTHTWPGQAVYKGSESAIYPAGHLKLQRYINNLWSVGGELGFTRWIRTGDWQGMGPQGQPLPKQQMTYVLADPAVTTALQVNRHNPRYETIGSFLRYDFYYGATAGFVFTVNDGSKGFLLPDSSSSVTRMSEYHYQSGQGYMFGLQAGFSYYLTDGFGFNAEISPRFAQVYTENPEYSGRNEKFNLFYLPVTLGFRFRL